MNHDVIYSKASRISLQRLAISRVILKAPRFIVFDEATSSLDSRSEKAMLEALNRVSHNATSLVIAHRLSTVVDADQIVVMDDGVIVETGTHDQLLQRDGLYRRLWELQQSEESCARPESADSKDRDSE